MVFNLVIIIVMLKNWIRKMMVLADVEPVKKGPHVWRMLVKEAGDYCFHGISSQRNSGWLWWR